MLPLGKLVENRSGMTIANSQCGLRQEKGLCKRKSTYSEHGQIEALAAAMYSEHHNLFQRQQKISLVTTAESIWVIFCKPITVYILSKAVHVCILLKRQCLVWKAEKKKGAARRQLDGIVR